MRRRSILGAIIVGYDEWQITIDVSSSSIENTGGTVNITPGATRIVHWSDKTTTIEYGIPTLSVSAGILSGRTLTIGANTSTSIKNITITATYEDVSEELNIQQAGKTIKSYSDWTITVSANPASGISAAGGTSTITRNASRIATWTDDSTTTETATPILSTNLGSISGNILTLEPNQTTSSISATITAAHSGKSATCTVSQNADTIAAYGDVNLTVGTIADVPASGGSRTSSGSSATQVLTWTSGRTTTVYPTITEGSVSNVASKGTTISNRSSLGNVTVTATGQGNKTASKTITAYQAGNYITKVVPSAISGNSHFSYSNIEAGGGTSSPALNGQATFTFTSGSTTTQSSTTWSSSGSTTYTRTYSGTLASGFTAINSSTGVVTASSRGTTTGDARSQSVSSKLTVTFVHSSTYSAGGSVSGNVTHTASVTQAANSRWVSSIYLVPYQPDSTWITTVTNGNWNTVPASGGYLKSYGYYRYTYTSGSTKDELATSDASLSWNTGYNSWITSHTNGGYYVANRTTTAGDARSATGTWSAAGFTATKAFTQQANAITNSNYSPYISAYGTPSVSIGSGITAGGGSATVSHSVTNTQTYYHLYTSGSTTSHTRSVAGTTTIKIQSNGNSRFSLSGNTLSHSSMGTSATTDSVTIRATNSGSTGKVKDASTSVTNSQTLSSISAWASHSSNKTSNGQNDWLAAGGGYIDGYCQANYSYTSGSTSTANVTSSTTWTSQGNYGSISGNRFTVPSRGTTTGGDRYNYIYASYGGKSASFNTGNQANSRWASSSSGGVTTYGNITAGTISNKTIPASGGSATATAGNGSQSWSKSAVVTTYTYTSGSTKNETTTAASSGSSAVAPSVSSYTASASSKGTTVSSTTTVGSKAVTWSANGKSASGTMYVYQAANAITNTSAVTGSVYYEDFCTVAQVIAPKGIHPTVSLWQTNTYTSGSTANTNVAVTKIQYVSSENWNSGITTNGVIMNSYMYGSYDDITVTLNVYYNNNNNYVTLKSNTVKAITSRYLTFTTSLSGSNQIPVKLFCPVGGNKGTVDVFAHNHFYNGQLNLEAKETYGYGNYYYSDYKNKATLQLDLTNCYDNTVYVCLSTDPDASTTVYRAGSVSRGGIRTITLPITPLYSNNSDIRIIITNYLL